MIKSPLFQGHRTSNFAKYPARHNHQGSGLVLKFFLLRKIALSYPHKCLLGFVEAKHGDQQEYLKFILVR